MPINIQYALPLPRYSRSDSATIMLIPALVLIIVGVLMTASAFVPWPFDFAVAVMKGWHVTVFPPPLFASALVILSGMVALVASFWR